MKIQIKAEEHRGEDDFIVDKSLGLFAVFDGVHNWRGYFPASIVKKRILERYDGDPSKLESILLDSDKELKEYGIATTAAIVALHDDIMHIFSAGDSVVYLVRKDKGEYKIEKITEEDNAYYEFIRNGKEQEAKARKQILERTLTNGIGILKEEKIKYKQIKIEPEMKIILATDGVTRYVGNELLQSVAIGDTSPEQLFYAIKEKESKEGSKDDKTLVIVDFENYKPKKLEIPEVPKKEQKASISSLLEEAEKIMRISEDDELPCFIAGKKDRAIESLCEEESGEEAEEGTEEEGYGYEFREDVEIEAEAEICAGKKKRKEDEEDGYLLEEAILKSEQAKLKQVPQVPEDTVARILSILGISKDGVHREEGEMEEIGEGEETSRSDRDRASNQSHEKPWKKFVKTIALTLAIAASGALSILGTSKIYRSCTKMQTIKPIPTQIYQVPPVTQEISQVTVTQTHPSQTQEPQIYSLIKNARKRVWLDNNTKKPDGNELELKVIGDAWDISGMQGVKFDELYLLLSFEDGKKTVFKFDEKGKTKGYITDGKPNSNIKTAEVVSLSKTSKGWLLNVYATYVKEKSEGKSEGKSEEKSRESKSKSSAGYGGYSYGLSKLNTLNAGLFEIDTKKLARAYEKDKISKISHNTISYNTIVDIYLNHSVEDARQYLSELLGYEISKKHFYALLDEYFGGIRKKPRKQREPIIKA